MFAILSFRLVVSRSPTDGSFAMYRPTHPRGYATITFSFSFLAALVRVQFDTWGLLEPPIRSPSALASIPPRFSTFRTSLPAVTEDVCNSSNAHARVRCTVHLLRGPSRWSCPPSELNRRATAELQRAATITLLDVRFRFNARGSKATDVLAHVGALS